jgi:hypothetical protein
MNYSIDIPVQPGNRLLVYETLTNGPGWKLGEPALYEVTNLSITQNKKKQWTKKIRAMRVVNNKTTDYGITLNFEDIGQKAFIQETINEKSQ